MKILFRLCTGTYSIVPSANYGAYYPFDIGMETYWVGGAIDGMARVDQAQRNMRVLLEGLQK